MALLLYNQQQAIKKISSNNAARYEQIAQEIEDSELAKLLGFPLLYDLQTNPATSANKALLEGAEFERIPVTVERFDEFEVDTFIYVLKASEEELKEDIL